MSEISRASVSWCGIMSENFVASNWEKQGGVSSPVLFCIFINDMLSALSTADVDCLLGHIFIEALAYADDIVGLLLVPTAPRQCKLYWLHAMILQVSIK
jgi:hypothetical protein